jgi:sugar phosphate isomerase/epimerase
MKKEGAVMKLDLSVTTFIMEMPLLIEEGSFRIGEGPLRPDKEKQLEKIFEGAAYAGFRKIDVAYYTLLRLGREKMEQILRRTGLIINCINIPGPYASPDVPDEIVVEDAKKAVDLAEIYGTRKIMLALAPADGDREEMYLAMVRRFNIISDYAASKGIDCLIEEDPKTNIPLGNSREVRRVLDHVPNCKLAIDTVNMMMALDEPVAFYEALSDKIVYGHLKDIKPVPEGTPFADVDINGKTYVNTNPYEGTVDFNAIFTSFEKHGFSGEIALEYVPWETDDFAEELKDIYRRITTSVARTATNPLS